MKTIYLLVVLVISYGTIYGQNLAEKNLSDCNCSVKMPSGAKILTNQQRMMVPSCI